MTRAKTIAEAMSLLRQDPRESVAVDVDGLTVELRVQERKSAAELFDEVGRWEGETMEELMDRLAEARKTGGSGEPPTL